jgi:cytochrome c2
MHPFSDRCIFFLKHKNRSVTYKTFNVPTAENTVKKKERVREGESLFLKSGCANCHNIHGQGSKMGASLNHLKNFTNPGFAKAWIVNPQEMRPGVRMPQAKLTEDQLIALLTYLYSVDN